MSIKNEAKEQIKICKRSWVIMGMNFIFWISVSMC